MLLIVRHALPLLVLLLTGTAPAQAEIRWASDSRPGPDGEIVYAAFSADPSLDNLLFYRCSASGQQLMVQMRRLWLPDDTPAPIPVEFSLSHAQVDTVHFQSGDFDGFYTATAQRDGQAEAFDALVDAIAAAKTPFTITVEGRELPYPPGAATPIDMTRASCGLD